MRNIRTQQDGITLLITLLVMGVLLAVSTSILSITLKQYQLSGIAYASETAFQAAGAGMECMLYGDFVVADFQVGGGRDSVQCFDSVSSIDGGIDDGDAIVDSGEEQKFMFSWHLPDSPEVCTEVSVYKFFSETQAINMTIGGKNFNVDRNDDYDNLDNEDFCPIGSVCTVVQSRGYNVPCAQVNSSPRVVEREYTQVY